MEWGALRVAADVISVTFTSRPVEQFFGYYNTAPQATLSWRHVLDK